jgi:trk system potassium uptake protein TrkH
MILRPPLEDFRIVGFYLGKILLGIAITMGLPFVLGLCLGEIDPALDFVLGIEIACAAGLALLHICRTEADLAWRHGMIIVSLAWIIAMLICAVPLYLSGHWKSFLDSCFEAMSGLTTSGLTLAQDLDHISYSHNLWRHLMMFLGGQGIVIVALSFFVKGGSGAFKMYVGEARDERILPNVIHSSRFIWTVSIVYLFLGTFALAVTGMLNGVGLFNSFFHGACIFMTAFDTGGFSPQSQSLLYYHSFPYEIVTMAIMLLGAINFKLHFSVWNGNRSELVKNIETRTLFATVILTLAVTLAGLCNENIYSSGLILFRKGFFQLISAHTGTGYQTVYPAQFMSDWNDLSLAGLIIAMVLGGAACSTTGAIKMIRIGIIFRALREDIKKILFPERAVIAQKFHHIKEVFLEDRMVRSALMITLAYLVLCAAGALAGMLYGFPLLPALFESTSAAANAGLSCGITSAGMPTALKIMYIFQMWVGRLEFVSVLTLAGFLYAVLKGR